VLVIGGVPVPYCLARIPPGRRGARQPRRRRQRRGAAFARGRPRDSPRRWVLRSLHAACCWWAWTSSADSLTEINVTSPTCFQEITDQTGCDVPALFMDALEAALAAGA
jgi:glutathione synthase